MKTDLDDFEDQLISEAREKVWDKERCWLFEIIS